MKSHTLTATASRARSRGLLFATSMLGLAVAGAAQAQTTQSPPLGGSGAQTLEEIVVTAQKRSESVQDVPIAITALSSEDVLNAGVTDTQDLKAAVPALNVTTGVGGFGLPRIRGIGATGQGNGIENPVAVYVDGVYYAAAFGVPQSLFDVEQVAVLKGPQGTLFGRNATGGLIQITTKGPDFENSGKVQAGYGNFNTSTFAGYATGRVTDSVALSLSGQIENRADGFGKNAFTGNDIQDGRTWAGRVKMLWEPRDTTSVLVTADLMGRDASDPAFRPYSINTLGQNLDQEIRIRGGDPKRDIFADVDPTLRARQWGTSVTITHDFGGFELKSITAYRNSDLAVMFDPDGTVQPRLRITNAFEEEQFTQEVNLVSQTEGPLNWVVGAFYMWDESYSFGRTTGLTTFGDNGYGDTISTVGLKSYSAFAELNYALTDKTNFIAGVRYTSDDRTFSMYDLTYNGNNRVTTLIPTPSSQRTFEDPSWRLSVDHRFTPELMVYASYNRGFRSGTFVTVSPPIVLRPEVVDAYEIGLKSDLFDRRVRLNLAGYYTDQDSVQVMQVIAGIQNVYNANGAEIYGVDGDITWQATDHLRLFGGFNYTDASYKSFPNAIISVPYPLASSFVIPPGQSCLGTFGNPRAQIGGNCLLRGDASGNQLQNTPKWTASVGGTLDIPTSAGVFTFAGNYYYNDGYPGTPDERVFQSSYETVDASVTWRHTNEALSVRLWGKNLTDALYRSSYNATNSADNGYAGPPRTYGVTVGYDF